MSDIQAYIDRISSLLRQAYHEFPFDLESEQPDIAIDSWIDEDRHDAGWFSGSDRYDQNKFIDLISNLECYHYRAMKKDNRGEPIYFNPLCQSFGEFRNSSTVIFQTNTPYPTPDMVRIWCNNQI